jgi:hypothetical protein
MRHLFTILVAALAGALAGFGTTHFTRPPAVTTIVAAPMSGASNLMSDAKVRRIEATTWPEMTQKQVDAVTVGAKQIGQKTVTVFCYDDAKCSDLALNLENAFETAHWKVDVKNSTMLPKGITASSKELVDMLNGATAKAYDIVRDADYSGAGDEYVTIGEKPKAR